MHVVTLPCALRPFEPALGRCSQTVISRANSTRFAPSSPFRKNNFLLGHPKSALSIPPSHPSRGADRESSRTRGGMRWTQQRRREACSQGGFAVSEQQRAD